MLRKAYLEGCGGNVIRCNESDTVRRWNRRRKRTQERRAAIVDFPTNQHGVIFMHRVVAVLHEHAAPIPELHGKSHASTRTQAIDVFAALFPGRNVSSATVAGQDLAFFKVDVDRVIPAAAAVLQRPDFTRSVTRSRRNASPTRVEHRATIGSNAPRSGLVTCTCGVVLGPGRQRL